jgi:four helix bundle protein
MGTSTPDNVLQSKSYLFARRSVKLHKHLVSEFREFVLSKQVLRSGTSIGANVVEAGQAESKPDFVHKLSVSLKEAFETQYWIELPRDGDYLTKAQAESLLKDCYELQKLLTSSIRTAKRSLTKTNR